MKFHKDSGPKYGEKNKKQSVSEKTTKKIRKSLMQRINKSRKLIKAIIGTFYYNVQCLSQAYFTNDRTDHSITSVKTRT